MLTIVVAKGAGVGGTGYLRIVEVCNYKVAYSKRRHGICEYKYRG